MPVVSVVFEEEVRKEVTIAPRDFLPIAAAEEDSLKFVRTARRPVRVMPSHVPAYVWLAGSSNQFEEREGKRGNIVERLTSFGTGKISPRKDVRVGGLPECCTCRRAAEEFLLDVTWENQHMPARICGKL